ncbi:MAG: hypothetical protein JXR86_00290 [Spirochaetales bacterium]|nr:hypothetical protein [Spirochaetales bacterium]
MLRAIVVLIFFAIFAAAVNWVAVSFLVSGETFSGDETAPSENAGGGRVNIILDDDDNPVSVTPESDEENEDDPGSDEDDDDIPRGASRKLGERSRQVDLEMATAMDIDSLPDLGSFSSTFSSSGPDEEKKTDSGEENEYNNNASFSSGRRLSPEGIAGTIAEQNSPEDLAKAVKTVMNKETK